MGGPNTRPSVGGGSLKPWVQLGMQVTPCHLEKLRTFKACIDQQAKEGRLPSH